MGLVYVVGFCTTDFPDGTTGSVPDAWAWTPPARTSDPTNANRTDRNNFVISLPLWTQRIVTWRTIRPDIFPVKTNWRYSFSVCRLTSQTGSTTLSAVLAGQRRSTPRKGASFPPADLRTPVDTCRQEVIRVPSPRSSCRAVRHPRGWLRRRLGCARAGRGDRQRPSGWHPEQARWSGSMLATPTCGWCSPPWTGPC